MKKVLNVLIFIVALLGSISFLGYILGLVWAWEEIAIIVNGSYDMEMTTNFVIFALFFFGIVPAFLLLLNDIIKLDQE